MLHIEGENKTIGYTKNKYTTYIINAQHFFTIKMYQIQSSIRKFKFNLFKNNVILNNACTYI